MTITTSSNGGAPNLTTHLQFQTQMQTTAHPNQNGAIVPTTQISITDVSCNKSAPNLDTVSGQNDELDVGNIVNEKHIPIPNRTDQFDGNNGPVRNTTCIVIENDRNETTNETSARELNFRNLKLQCMCSEDECSTDANIGRDAIGMKRLCGDDETEIEISDVEAVTEMSESMFENHRCSHCGRDHCCFFLRCCYCTANAKPSDGNIIAIDATVSNSSSSGSITNVAVTNPITSHGNKPSELECGANRKSNINNIPKVLPIDCRMSTEMGDNQNLASKRCDEICEIIRNQHGIGLCNSTVAPSQQRCCEKDINYTDKHCADTNSREVGCHCRWYCIQDCDADLKLAKNNSDHTNNRTKCETSLAVQEPEIVSPITNESPLIEENRLRCCRCSKELF